MRGSHPTTPPRAPRVFRLKLCANAGVAATANFRSSSRMSSVLNYPVISVVLTLAVMARILLRPNRVPASRVAWLVVVGAVPVVGIVAYLLLGEVNIGRRRAARVREALARMPEYEGGGTEEIVPERYRNLSGSAIPSAASGRSAEIPGGCCPIRTRRSTPWWPTSMQPSSMCICSSTSGSPTTMAAR